MMPVFVSFVQLEDVPQAALEPGRSTDQETSKPPERVPSLSIFHLFFFFCPLLGLLNYCCKRNKMLIMYKSEMICLRSREGSHRTERLLGRVGCGKRWPQELHQSFGAITIPEYQYLICV